MLPNEMQQQQPPSRQQLMHSQQACSISQQVLSPLVQVIEQPSLVKSHLQVPQHRLHWTSVIP
ncbi:MAG TPA: hypothetical protein VGX76_08140, partial [Pirellulales bacterium]|nr:hypothetical protein [Pirellulales bacterium]